MFRGQWLADCPKCRNASQVDLSRKKIICISCHRGIIATAYAMQLSRTANGSERQLMRPVADLEIREKAAQQARAMDEEYEIIFPAGAVNIEQVLSKVRDPRGRCWFPDREEIRALHPRASAYGQSIRDLVEEVSNYGLG